MGNVIKVYVTHFALQVLAGILRDSVDSLRKIDDKDNRVNAECMNISSRRVISY